jgi:hypothetical protein
MCLAAAKIADRRWAMPAGKNSSQAGASGANFNATPFMQ